MCLLLRDAIHERTGIFFEEDRVDMLLEKLEPLARERNCQSFLGLYYLLKYEENGTADWSRVADALSVQETYFWREFSQIEALVTRAGQLRRTSASLDPGRPQSHM